MLRQMMPVVVGRPATSLLAVFVLLFSRNLFAQVYPSFPAYEVRTNLTTRIPSALYFKGQFLLYSYYQGSIEVASSTNTTTFTTHNAGIVSDSQPAACAYGGGVYVIYVVSGQVKVITSADGINFTTAPITIPYAGAAQSQFPPSCAATNQNLGADFYISWIGSAYNPGTGGYDGVFPVGVVTTDGRNFPSSPRAALSRSYTAYSATTMTLFGSYMYLSFLDSAGNPHVYRATSNVGPTFAEITGSSGSGGVYRQNPSFVVFNGILYEFFRSKYDDNSWANASYDGVTWAAPHKYAQRTTVGPSVITDGTQVYEFGPDAAGYVTVSTGR